MLLATNLKLMLIAAAGLAGPLAVSARFPGEDRVIAAHGDQPALIELQPGNVRYRASGEFTRAHRPAEAPVKTLRIEQPLTIMQSLVSSADYARCVADRACQPLGADVSVAIDLPAVQVSWRDAQAYADWLSRRTSGRYRLPTDDEWAYAAGSRWQDDGVPVDAADPSRRSLARYERESKLKETAVVDGEPKPFGSFGTNENGLVDLAGNVWEWTSSCFVRTALDDPTAQPIVNCGVRVVEGRHRTYITDFIRDARAGGCAAGVPPSNLGFRLVREPNDIRRWLGL
jgi:formylglycine-generating enzyme required for sulfatase activity